MKKTKKRATNPKAKPRRTKKNPGVSVRKVKTPHRRRRNPGNGPLSKGLDFAKTGLAALVGLVLTRQLPQMVLKEKNSGAMGYGANVVTAVASAALASRFAGRQIGAAVGVGGALYVANRILSEQVSPVGKVLSLSGLGDPLAADRRQLAGIRPGYFASPEVYDRNGNAVIPDAIDNRVRAIGAPPAAKMAGLRFAA